MSRVKEFDEDQALKSAEFLFWERGFAGTSMQALEDTMGLSRTSIYNTFGNKRALYQKALERYMNTELVRFLKIIEKSSTFKSARQAILKETISHHFRSSHPGGCLVVLSVLEDYQHDKITRKILQSAILCLQQGLEQRVIRAVKEGELPTETQCATEADQVVALIAGILVLAKANTSKKRLKELVRKFD